jgi:hypothetical protein
LYSFGAASSSISQPNERPAIVGVHRNNQTETGDNGSVIEKGAFYLVSDRQ